MDDSSLLEHYDRTVRMHPAADGGIVESIGAVICEIHESWAGVGWSDLDASSADAAIAQAVQRLGELGREWEWKLYSHDSPDDLGSRLVRAGLVAEPAELLAIGPIDELALGPPAPPDVELESSVDSAALVEMFAVQDVVFNRDHTAMLDEMRCALDARPSAATGLIARVAGRPVGSARLTFHPGGEFAGLYGTAVLPEQRGQGIFRALVGECAALARSRGFVYLHADLNDQSAPILARCGFRMPATTTPYTMPAPER